MAKKVQIMWIFIQKAFKIYDFYDYNTVDEFLNQLEIRTKQSSYGLCGNFNYEDLQTQKGVFWMANYEGDPTMNPNNFELAEKLSNNCLKNIFEFLGFSLSETVLNYTKKLFETYKGIDINTYNYINKKECRNFEVLKSNDGQLYLNYDEWL